MEKAILGFAAGIILSILGVFLAMRSGEEFRSTVLKYGAENGTGIVATDRFVVLYDGVSEDDAGSASITYAGRDGVLPALWTGYSCGWGGGERGISAFHTYDPKLGQAILYCFGKLILVEESGRFLRVQDGRFPLGEDMVVVAVDADGFCKALTDEEAQKTYEALDPWYKDGVGSTRPLRLDASVSMEAPPASTPR